MNCLFIQDKIAEYFLIKVINSQYKHIRTMPDLTKLFSQLPFLKSYPSCQYTRFITIAKIHTFLGTNFYTRLSTIYGNLLEAIAKRNYKYLGVSIERELYGVLVGEMKAAEEGRFKMRVAMPMAKIVTTADRERKARRFEKMRVARDKIWQNGVTRIGVNCRVYFGEKFDRNDPLKINEGKQFQSPVPQAEQPSAQQQQTQPTLSLPLSQQQHRPSKLYRVGQFRYLRYYPHLGLWGNLKNMYKQQTYELIVKYSSKMHLQIRNYDETAIPQTININNSNENAKQNQQILSQITMRSSNEHFDWVVVNINGIRDGISKREKQNQRQTLKNRQSQIKMDKKTQGKDNLQVNQKKKNQNLSEKDTGIDTRSKNQQK